MVCHAGNTFTEHSSGPIDHLFLDVAKAFAPFQVKTFGDLNQRYSPDHFAAVNPALSSSGTTSCRSASNFRGSGVSAEDSVSSCLPEDRNALKSSIGDADMGEIRFTFLNLASMLSELTYRKRRLP